MVDKVILGSAQFGLKYGINNQRGILKQNDVFNILEFANRNGIKLIDTAEGYGKAERFIGNFNRKSENKYNINTKFIYNERKNIRKQILDTIERLGVKKLDSLMFHSYENFKSLENFAISKLLELKNEGLIEHIGVSVYQNEEILSLANLEYISIIQFPYNILDNDNQRGEVIKALHQKGKIIQCRSIFLQGLFFKEYLNWDKKLNPLKIYLRKVNNFCSERNISIEHLSLYYPLMNKNINYLLIGLESIEQLRRNIEIINNFKSFDKKILQEMKDFIDTINVAEVDLLNPQNW